eukprot:CAMPEP_0206148970 /NCGR_PEP_ID=MMETSP1473-20131121/37533_1 /ASSEMBLY_ACC=CAM_ASM_001109 /TAXON_ID=1461547 /ORGANISM="Stichococcus sp, Strain RCC1054" /LENGTH=757 /DNA_ID=CAMNT_0053546407 /DNA_START=2913 /DNA_END=5186 /DNA_ORIENTATION=-
MHRVVQQLGPALKATGFVSLCAVTGYECTQMIESALMYRHSTRIAREYLDGDSDLQDQLGLPVMIGPWWNAAIGVRPGLQVADCTLPLAGSDRKGTVMLQMARIPSKHASVLMYHMIGPGEWRRAAISVMVPKAPGAQGASASGANRMKNAGGGQPNTQGHVVPVATSPPADLRLAPERRRGAHPVSIGTGSARSRLIFIMENPTQFITQLGMMNRISSGNSTLDILLCMLLPLLMAKLMPYMEKLREWWLMAGNKQYKREIQHTKRAGWYHSQEGEESNHLLQQAVLMYLGCNQQLCESYNTAQVELIKGPNGDIDKDELDSDCESDKGGSDNDSLGKYKVVTVPPCGQWVEVEDSIEFMRMEKLVEKGDGKRCDTSIHFHFQSSAKNGIARIDSFISRAFSHYKAAMEEREKDDIRHLYTPVAGESAGGDDVTKGLAYKRYPLADAKTFESLFHPEKESILRLVDHFQQRKGKFAIAGFQHKLGLLLHGPPGTGKTSLVKALAHYTNRSIVSVPLTLISTNQQLADVVFDAKYNVVGEELASVMGYSKTIFLLEDVDAVGSIVQKRTSSAAAQRQFQRSTAADTARTPQAPTDLDSWEDADLTSNEANEVSSKVYGPEKKSALSTWADHPDKLNLAGLLNVIDGIIECPGRILVMTTNVPEQLDPALIRPGRISKRIYMGRLVLHTALAMVTHYFYSQHPTRTSLPSKESEAFTQVFQEDTLTPAELEMLCCEYDTVDELVSALTRHYAAAAAST